MENRVCNAIAGVEVESTAIDDIIARIDDVTQHRKQQFARTANHSAVDESIAGCAFQGDLQSPVLLNEADAEILVGFEHLARIVRLAARVQHGQHAASQQ